MRHVGVGGHFAAVEVDGEGDVAFVGEMLRLFLHPVVEAPPFVNDDDGRMRAGASRQVKEAVRGVAAAGKGDWLHVGWVNAGTGNGEAGKEKQGRGEKLAFHYGSFGQTTHVSQKTSPRGKRGGGNDVPARTRSRRFRHRI